MKSGAYGPTHGTDERVARPLMAGLLAYSLPAEIARLRSEEEYRDNGANSVTLAKSVDFRVLLSALSDGQSLHQEDGDARASVQLLEGRAALHVDSDAAHLQAGDLATLDAGHGWRLTADGECAVLLTLAWPREKAGV